MISLTFPFAPVAKGRPRFGSGRTYTPDKTRRFESDLRLWASKYAPRTPLTGPLKVTASFIVKPPKKRTCEFPIKRPDLDNFLKCFDSFNGLLWADDSQIVQMNAEKIFDMSGKGPRIELRVEQIETKEREK